jgi:hypothetical protein
VSRNRDPPPKISNNRCRKQSSENNPWCYGLALSPSHALVCEEGANTALGKGLEARTALIHR